MTFAKVLQIARQEGPPDLTSFALSEYGVTLGETPCRECGEPLTADRGMSNDQKCACGCPWSRKCHECGELVHPLRMRDGWWDQAQHRCVVCVANQQHMKRRDSLATVFPDLESKLEQARTYKTLPHRAALDAALSGFQTGLMLVWGSYGSGKTVSVLHWAARRHMSGEEVLWVPARRLVEHFKRELPDGESQDLRSRLHACRVLVIDDWQAMAEGAGIPSDWTDNVQVRWSYLLQDVMDTAHKRATVLITNRGPDGALGVLPGRLRSRFHECGQTVQCAGPDLRKG